MKKTPFILLLVSLLFLTLTISCSTYLDPPTVLKSHWKLTSTEIWGVEPLPDAPYKQFATFPFNLTYPWGIDTYTYAGFERNVSRSEFWGLGKVTKSITYTWSQMPDIIYPDTDYKITYESKGDVGNGINVSTLVYYPDQFSWFPGSFRNGPQTATLRISAPDSNSNHQRGKLGVNMSSGRSYYMEWWYVYEWVQ